MSFQVNDTIIDTLRYFPDGFSVAEYRHHTRVKDLKVSMDLPRGGRIYGISFESAHGLQMDNIAMRGGSGLIFTKMDSTLQAQMMDYLVARTNIAAVRGKCCTLYESRLLPSRFQTRTPVYQRDMPGYPDHSYWTR